MTGQLPLSLAVAPLATYLFVLSLWHGGRHPRIVSGLADFALLAFGLGGLVVFGPLGQGLARILFRRPALLDWMALASVFGLVATLLARRSLRRLTVYHVDPEALVRALRETLDQVPGHFVRTLRGFEDRSRARGLTIEVTSSLRAAQLEAFGTDPEGLIQELRPRLRLRLRRVEVPPSQVAWWLLGGSGLLLLIPMARFFLNLPQAHDALRVLIERLQGS
jgi:hypothetical protein